MIIYDLRKPVEFQNGNCVGVTGENLAYTQEFLIKGMRDTSVNYTIHLRFADGSVNSVIPDSTLITSDGTRLVWQVKKTDIFKHGYFELQIEGRGEDGLIFQTEIATLYADESLAVEDKEYANPNSETLRLRDEANGLVNEIKAQQQQIEHNYELIEQTDLNAALSGKLDSRDNSVHFRHLNADVFADEIAGGNTRLVRSTTVYSALEKKADAEDVNSGLALKVNNANVITEFDKLFSDPKKIPTVMAVMDYLNGYYYSAEETYSDSDIESKLAEKYDASNVETGSGQLSVGDAADTSVVKSAAFEYQRVGTIVNVFIKIVFNAGTGNYFSFSGLPYATASPLDLSNKHKYTTVTSKYQQTTVAPLHSGLAVFFNRTVTFAQDEELSFHICQKIK